MLLCLSISPTCKGGNFVSDAPVTTHTVLFDLRELAVFNEHAPNIIILADTGDARIAAISLRAGQSLRDICTSSQHLIQCLRGRALLTIEDATNVLHAGIVVLVDASTIHAVIAQTDCIILMTLTPAPVTDNLAIFSGDPLIQSDMH